MLTMAVTKKKKAIIILMDFIKLTSTGAKKLGGENKMAKKMTDKQLLARIEELDKRALARFSLETTDKQLATKIKKMDFVAAYRYLMDNTNYLYADWLLDRENDEYEKVLDEIEKRGLN